MSRAWDKEKIWDSDRIRTYDLPNTGRALFVHLSYEELMESDAIYIYILGSYLTRVLHTARISNVDVVLCGERMKDDNFWSSKKQMWKWINQHVGGQGKNLRPHQDSNLWPSKHRAGALSTELRRTHGERGHILGLYLTRVLLTAKISNVDVVLCGERMFAGTFAGRWELQFLHFGYHLRTKKIRRS